MSLRMASDYMTAFRRDKVKQQVERHHYLWIHICRERVKEIEEDLFSLACNVIRCPLPLWKKMTEKRKNHLWSFSDASNCCSQDITHHYVYHLLFLAQKCLTQAP